MSTPEIRIITLEEAQALWEMRVPLYYSFHDTLQRTSNEWLGPDHDDGTSPEEDHEQYRAKPQFQYVYGVAVE